jgi:hypothetical protein
LRGIVRSWRFSYAPGDALQVMPVVAEEYEIFVVVTVYVYFFGGVK